MDSISRTLLPIPEALLPLLASLGLRDAFAGKHLLITGGTGFFGKWLLSVLAELNRQGAEVTVTVASRDPQRFLSSWPVCRYFTWLDWIPGDIRELSALPGRNADFILHAAADTSAAAGDRPLELFQTIVQGAQRVYELALRSGMARVLITGSGAQYGSLPVSGGVCETYAGACSSNTPSSAYGEGKRVQETLGALYGHSHGLEVVMTRCFAFAGPGLPLDGHFAIGNFVRDALLADEVVLNSSGEAVRSYLHGADLAIWLLTLLIKGKSGVAYNVGSDSAVSIAELARRVVARLAPHKTVRVLGRPEGLSRSNYVPDISRARELGLEVWTSLDASIDSMATWASRDGTDSVIGQSRSISE
ncbi:MULTISPECIES: NAD-dependent epimerase/dehydratase family protein [Pseudomonas]|uniref:NAD(P)-dependent oxidoreductase n=1 Tax=Pseudomonas peradeniyensis TaxID=2745488 RepID=A0ABT2VC57_9PSED|nr:MULTISPECIES: NAD(P)-dependent oxidoreductase [unclassified Pseudomonas]MCU7239314.1 NAD(P)-dependent oxidoreductase [Pseudomonas peradeniyensis]MCU7281542.1 NAD(P)-dependent oxidoreductase [Pseudomonas peradeniyensis]